ncbi:MAG TPA: hypothetical protein VFD30_19080 [Terriglobia bacterium]|nr:hypothetical protein [Terriglobia bacterium]
MILAVIFVVAAALALIFILGISFSRGLQLSNTGSLAARIQPVDLEAFRNLADPAEDDYLRRRLPPAEFRAVRRRRLRAMAAYVQVAARNATVLVRIGQAALAARDPRTAEAAYQLVHQALLLRRNAALALLRIYVALAWPNSGPAASLIVRGYEQLNGSAMLLGRLQNPAEPVRISAGM